MNTLKDVQTTKHYDGMLELIGGITLQEVKSVKEDIVILIPFDQNSILNVGCPKTIIQSVRFKTTFYEDTVKWGKYPYKEKTMLQLSERDNNSFYFILREGEDVVEWINNNSSFYNPVGGVFKDRLKKYYLTGIKYITQVLTTLGLYKGIILSEPFKANGFDK